MKPWKALKVAPLLLLTLIIALSSGEAGNETASDYVLFNGINVADSSERASPWIPVRGANRVIIRLWSANAGAHTGADSQYVDSIGIFRVLFSDSVSFMGRDSAGTLVTASSTFPSHDSHGVPFPVCADSVMITGVENAVTPDTTYKMAAIALAPLAKRLRTGVNGSGVYTLVVPALPPAGTSIYGDGSIMPQYMRIRVTPYTRLTTAGFSSTQGIRTKGINKLRATAQVIYKNK